MNKAYLVQIITGDWELEYNNLFVTLDREVADAWRDRFYRIKKEYMPHMLNWFNKQQSSYMQQFFVYDDPECRVVEMEVR